MNQSNSTSQRASDIETQVLDEKLQHLTLSESPLIDEAHNQPKFDPSVWKLDFEKKNEGESKQAAPSIKPYMNDRPHGF